MENKSKRECVIEALAHERAGRWSKASEAWAAAALAEGAPEPAKRGARREDATGIAPGTTLRHLKRGVVEAECTFVAEGDIVFAGTSYDSLSAAANAAAASLGRKSKTLNGWVYWGLDKQGLDGDLDLTASDDAGEDGDEEGFDQVAGDLDEEDDVEGAEANGDERRSEQHS